MMSGQSAWKLLFICGGIMGALKNIFIGSVFSVLAPFVAMAANEDVAAAVVCRGVDGAVVSVESHDVYEGRTLHKMNFSTAGDSLENSLLQVRQKLEVLFTSVTLPMSPAEQLDKVQNKFTISQDDVTWAPINDTTAVLPAGCGLERMADSQGDQLQIHGALWTQMDSLNQAAVIVHEALRLFHYPAADLQRGRKVVAVLFSDVALEPIMAGVPEDANECTAYNVLKPDDVAFHFYKFQNPKNDIEEVLQFTKFRGQLPLSPTTVTTPKWSWPKEDGDLYTEVQSNLEDFEHLFIRREFPATGDAVTFYFDELSGDYQVSCAKPPQSPLGLLKITSLGAFENVAVGGRRTLMFEVSNLGEGKALSMTFSALAAPFSFAGGTYPGQGGTCGANLAAKSKCSLAVQFAPTSTGPFSSTLIMKYNNGTSADQAAVDMSGVGASPALVTISGASTSAYDFGTVTAGASRETIIQMSNAGGIRATGIREQGLEAPFAFKGGKYPGEGGTCGEALDANTNCNLVVVFQPTSVAVFKDALEVFYSNGATENMTARSLVGTGGAPGILTMSGVEPLDLGVVAVGSSLDVTLTLTNTGSSQIADMTGLGMAAPFTFANGYYPGKSGTCYKTLQPKATCTIVVRFTPTVTSSSSDTVDVSYYDGAKKQIASKTLIASGASPAVLTLSDAPKFNFGFVSPGSTVEHVFTMANLGAVPATAIQVNEFALPFQFVGGQYPGKGGTCSSTLSAGATCTLRVSFAPENDGAYDTALNISYSNGIVAAAISREISGRAGEPAQLVTASGTVHSFGPANLQSTQETSITIVNTGKTVATNLKTAALLEAPFAFKGGKFPGEGGTCGETLEIFDSCSVVITFSPTLAGLHKDALALSYFNGVAQQIVVQYLEGTGISSRGNDPWNLLFTGL